MFPVTALPGEALERYLSPRRRTIPTKQLLMKAEEQPLLDEYAAWLAAGNRPVPAAAERTLEDRGLARGASRTMEFRPDHDRPGPIVPLAGRSPGDVLDRLGLQEGQLLSDADLERLRRSTIGIVPGSVRDVTPPPTPRDTWADQTAAPATGPSMDPRAAYAAYLMGQPKLEWDGRTLVTRDVNRDNLARYLSGMQADPSNKVMSVTERREISPQTIAANLSGTREATPEQRLAAEELYQRYITGLGNFQNQAVTGPQLEREKIASAERIAGQHAGLQRDLERMRQRDLSAYLFGLTTGKITPDQFSTLLDAREMLDETGRSSPRTEEGRSLRDRLTDKFKALATKPTDEDFHIALDPAVSKEGKLDVDRLLRGVAGHTKVRQALPDVARRLLERGVGSPADVAAQLERAMYDRMHFSGTPEIPGFTYRHGLTRGPWMETPRGQVPIRGYGLMGSPSTLGYALTSREDAARYRDELPLLADMLQQIYTVGNLGTKPKP